MASSNPKHAAMLSWNVYTGVMADKSLVRPTSRCILFDDENISFDANLVIYIYIINLQLWYYDYK